MKFFLEDYVQLINSFKNSGYKFIFFGEENLDNSKEVILRHDVDFSLLKALKMAKIENDLGVKSTYFILIGTEFYNPFLYENRKIIKEILQLGHSIGVHFDVANYENNANEDLLNSINDEINILSNIISKPINCISFHRPIKELLNKKISNDFISAYEERYFKEFSYISDSRFNWKNNPYELISNHATKIQCLVHPIWYSTNIKTSKQIVCELLDEKNKCINNALYKNITNYDDFIGED